LNSYSTGFTEYLVAQICEHSKYFHNVDDVIMLTDIWTTEQAHKVMEIVDKYSETNDQ